MEDHPLDDLNTIYKATWDASWGANNMQEVSEAFARLWRLLKDRQIAYTPEEVATARRKESEE